MAKKKKTAKKTSKKAQQDWRIYRRDAAPHADIQRLPAAPPWRPTHDPSVHTPDAAARDRGASFRATEAMEEMVNAALYLRRPLLLTGKPGSGKSSLIHAVARQLKLGRVLRWSVTSRSTLKDALYRYDALARLQKQQMEKKTPDIGEFLELGPLGTALLPSKHPRALLIDEIDKSDIDLPNDLLNVFEEGEFEIPELTRLGDGNTPVDIREHESSETQTIVGGRVQCTEFPFVIMTSNGERDFPPAFLRRCLRFQMPVPDDELLGRIVESHLGQANATEAKELIAEFAQRTNVGNESLATDQLLNAIFIVSREHAPDDGQRQRLLKVLLKELTSDTA